MLQKSSSLIGQLATVQTKDKQIYKLSSSWPLQSSALSSIYPDNKNSNRLTLPKRQTRRPSSSRVPLNCFIITRHVAVVSKQTEFTFQNCPEFFIFPRIDYHICAGVENKKEVGKDTHVRRPIQKNRIIGNSIVRKLSLNIFGYNEQ